MVERIQNSGPWARTPSAGGVKRVQRRGANDGDKEFFRKFGNRYSGMKERETDEEEPGEKEPEPNRAAADPDGSEEEVEKRAVRDKSLGNSIDIRI